MAFTRNLSKINKNDVSIAGGKAASLGEMMQAGTRVPSGFVILSNAYDDFVKEGTLNNISEEILKSFMELNTEYVAVRSSATPEDGKDYSWAGQFDSYLNVTKENLLEKIKECFLSVSNSQALSYLSGNGIKDIKMPVIVQKMIEAECAGVAFSVHPVTEDPNHIVIEVVEGLGESLVSGSATPDSYVIEKDSHKIIEIKINNETGKQLLFDLHIQELSSLIVSIENHFGFPCDIEWAYEKGEFYILQSRPITTLTKNKNESYRLIFSSEGYSVMNAYNLLFAGYVSKGGVILCENNDKVSLYIRELELKHYGKIGLEIFSSSQKTQELIEGINKHIENLSILKENFNFDKMGDSSNKELADYYETSQKSVIEFLSLYNLLESHHTILAEKTIQEYIDKHSEKYKDLTLFDLIFNNADDIEDVYIRTICENIALLAKFKLEASEKAFRGSIGVLKEIKKRLHLSPDDTLYSLNSREIRKALLEGLSYDTFKKIENERKNYFVIETDAYQNASIFVGDEANEKIEFLKSHSVTQKYKRQENSNGIEMRGQVASRGIHTGRAVVIPYITNKDNEEYKRALQSFKKGNILVTKNTVPEIMEIIKMAGAIITEEGGITCHGAVIAREFEIPGIVGVEGAIEIIKTGDVVEVNANEGIIRIVN